MASKRCSFSHSIHRKQKFKSTYNGRAKVTPKKNLSQCKKCPLSIINVCGPHTKVTQRVPEVTTGFYGELNNVASRILMKKLDIEATVYRSVDEENLVQVTKCFQQNERRLFA